MGIYLNPAELGGHPYKDAWLAGKIRDKEVVPVDVGTFKSHVPGADGKYGIAFIDNGMFDAIGVAFDAREAEAFTDIRDGRDVSYFLIPEDKIKEYDANAYKVLKMATDDAI
jgi:hypothetical protein